MKLLIHIGLFATLVYSVYANEGEVSQLSNVGSSRDQIISSDDVKNSSYPGFGKESSPDEQLIHAVGTMYFEGAEESLKKGADPNALRNYPMYLAIKNKDDKMIALLLEKGAVADPEDIEAVRAMDERAHKIKLPAHILAKLAKSRSDENKPTI